MADDPGIFGNVFNDKRVLVTGHTGFKGSWLALWLNGLGAKVAGYSLEPPTRPSLFDELGLAAKVTHVIGDVRDPEALSAIFAGFRPEIVFHLAAQPLVRYSYREPRLTYETNVMGTVNVLEAARGCGSVRVVVNITSDKCYENRERDYSYRESDPMGGYDPYSSSKGCAELVTAAYRGSFFGGDAGSWLASARAGNVVGGGDWAEDRLVPDCARALSQGDPVVVRNPGAVRPWQFVLEPLAGYLSLAASMWSGGDDYEGAWNFGPDSEGNVPVQRVVEAAISAWGEGEWRGHGASSNGLHEAHLLMLDCAKAKQALGWRPVYGVEEAIGAAMDWYRAYYDGGSDMVGFAEADIARYVKRARKAGLAWAGPAGKAAI